MAPKYHKKYHKERLVASKVDVELILRLFSYLLPFKKWLMFGLMLLVIGKSFEAFVPIYIGKMAQNMLSRASDQPAGQELLSQILWGASLLIAVIFLSYISEVSNVVLKSTLGQKAIVNLRCQVYRHILNLPLNYFDRNAVGRLMTRTIHDIDQIDLMFTDSVIPLIGNIILFFCMAIFMVILNWQAALIVGCVLPLLAWVLYTFRKYQRNCYEMVRAVVAAMNAFIQEHLSGMSTIHNFGLEKKERRRFQDLNEDYCTAYFESIKHFGFLVSGIDFLSSLAIILVFIVLAGFNAGQSFQAGVFFAFSLYIAMLFRPLIDLAERYNVLQSALAASERIFKILDQKVEIKDPYQGINLERVETIEFKDVWFAYTEEYWVLKGLNMTLKQGETLAIVGITGAGKSSIMSLLLRFYEFQKGDILINGRGIREYSLASLREQFSVVFQDPVLFSGTLEDNITLYEPSLSLEKINSVVNFVNLKPIVDMFPNKLKHRINEQGKSLSMGEKQLVSMARAVAHERSVLLFDEATSNIDAANEKMIQQALDKILKQKTALVIAHRLSTVKNVTKIAVLHDGKICELGTHSELLSAKGFYEKLYRLQDF